MRHATPVGFRGIQRIVGICDGEDARSQRNLLEHRRHLGHNRGPVKRMVLHGQHVDDRCGDMQCLQQIDRSMMMQQYKIVLFTAEFSGFLQNVFRDAQLAEVVQQPGHLQLATLFIVPAQQASDAAGDCRDPLTVQKN